MTMVSPMRSSACMTFGSHPGGSMPGGAGSGLSLNRINVWTWAPSALR
jgi:hypothetical protein